MKKLFVVFALVMMCVNLNAQYNRIGNDYTPVSSSSSSRVPKDSIITEFTWKSYPIIIRKADGKGWVCRISSTTHKFRREYIPEDVNKDVCRQINIKYTYVKKTKTTK